MVFKLYSRSALLKFIMHTYHLRISSDDRYYSVSLAWGLGFFTAAVLPGDADDHFEEGLQRF